MTEAFQTAGGTVPGRDHLLAAKNSHDAYAIRSSPDVTAVVVCDGCGSGAHSEVGAKLGAVIAANAVYERHVMYRRHLPDDRSRQFWGQVREDILLKLSDVSSAIGGKHSAAVTEYLLFTLVIALVADRVAEFVSIGDGVCIVNGERIALGPFADNAPPYLAYDLLPSHRHGLPPAALDFVFLRELPSSELHSFLIGTDGAEALIAAQEKVFPGTEERIGPIDRLWTEDRFYKNPDMLRRHLARANLARPHGLLTDDTTIVVGRRKAVSP